MNNHDIVKSVMRERELLERVSPAFGDLSADIDEIMAQSENPKVLAALMFRLIQEREKTNHLLQAIDEKYDRIMLSLKTPETNSTQTQNRFEVLPEQDQAILKLVEERGGCTANDIKAMMNYKGLNAACQRLNKLFREGHLKKVQSGRKVLYLAKS